MKDSPRRGFTLIELLVVISIIGLLSSIVLVSVNSARKSSFDARRVSELNQIRTALELYHLDNGHYPYLPQLPPGLPHQPVPPPAPQLTRYESRCPAWSGCSSVGPEIDWSNLATALVPKYMPTLPVDPTGTVPGYHYISREGQYFQLSAYLEVNGSLAKATNAWGPYYYLTSGCVHDTYWDCD